MALPAFAARYIAGTGFNSGTQWDDQSGNGNHITAAGAGGGSWPTQVTACGKTFLRFNGSSNRLVIPNAVTMDRQNCSVFIVARSRSNNGDCAIGLGAWPGVLFIVRPGNIPAVYDGGYNEGDELAGDNFTLMGLRGSGSALGVLYGAEETLLAALASGTKVGGAVGASDTDGNLPGVFDIAEVMVCAARATDAELLSVRDYCVDTYGCGSGTKDRVLYMTGDSLFAGFDITTPTRDHDVLAELERLYTEAGLSCPKTKLAAKSGWRIGESGSTNSLFDDLTTDAAGWLTAHAGYTINGVVCNACVNDALLDSKTAAQIATRATNYIAEAISKGATDVYMGTMSVSDGSSQETLRLAYNLLLKAITHEATGPRYFDIGAATHLGVYAERTNATYFQLDQLHWTAAGDTEAAGMLYRRLVPSTLTVTAGPATVTSDFDFAAATSQVFTFTNTGPGPMTIDSIELTGAPEFTFASPPTSDPFAELDADEADTATINRAVGATGPATLTVTGDFPGSPLEIELTGDAAASPSGAAVTVLGGSAGMSTDINRPMSTDIT